MRNISFALTTAQINARTKTVTRRKGWKFARVGEQLRGVKKAMGLKPGEKIEELCRIEIVNIRREPLNAMTDDDCAREGFPKMKAPEFIAMFCDHMGGDAAQTVTRIEFRYC